MDPFLEWDPKPLTFDKAFPQASSLVPYDGLPESKEEYYRKTAMGTLKTMLALEYRIEKTP
jgi:RyR domain